MRRNRMILLAILVVLAIPVMMGVAFGSGEAGDAAAEAVKKDFGWLSIIPPVLAIGMALVTRQVVVALLLGVYCGSLIITGNPGSAFLRVGDTYLVGALADESHAAILLFSSILGGMVGVLSRSGATEGVVRWLTTRVAGRRGGQASTVVMGTIIFFDDYANTLLVGSTMRPWTDRLKISREKLAYLVDSTAAPVATVAVISTWVGFEVGLIQEAMSRLGPDTNAYTFFLQTIPYSYYPLLTLLFVYLIAFTGRDFGPMRSAERRAYHEGHVLRPGARPASDAPQPDDELAAGYGGEAASPLLAGIPILSVILTTALGIYFNGRQAALAAGTGNPTLRDALNHADSFAVLTWAALIGATLAVVLVVGSRRLTLMDAMDGFMDGVKAMVIAVTILLLAWSLSAICDGLGTANYLVDVSRQVLSARLLPMVVFILAAAVSFATGTSWGTMAILMPLVYPLGHQLPLDAGLPAATALHIHLAAVSAVLAGAVFGDHCSPISDTTILSSLASGSDHVDHVKTQMPYALTVAGISALCGYLPVGFGVSPWVSLGLGVAGVVLVIWRVGKTVHD
ncbi:MAG: Na+/H+ antiporter NhaC family protein [Candidatus Krumholzibacteria bacterium]|nr:Na+/H+ antiporter NhaC family protein [Candidatus Krumholzibacteria bacterium]